MVEWDDGSWEEWHYTVSTFTTDRSNIETQFPDERRASQRGTIVGGSLAVKPGTIKRGQFYGQLGLWRNNLYFDPLASGYLYSRGAPALGEFHEPGPGGGEGYLSWVPAFTADRAGNAADVTYPLATANALRKVYGFVWFYHADGNAASRTMRVRLQNLGGALPTGFTAGVNSASRYFPAAGVVTLTVNEEGFIGAYTVDGGDKFVWSSDNGALTRENTAGEPSPFPLLVTEDELAELYFDSEAGLAGDRHSAYVLIEEWLVPS